MTDDMVVRLRRELAYVKRENAALVKDRDRALAQWTAERTRWLGENRSLRAQLREVERVLYRQLEVRA